MASENETVAEIREDVHEYLTSIGPGEYPDEEQFDEFADRFVAAHKREVAELCECLKEAIREKCPFTRMSCKHGEPCDYECGTDKWRKALERAKDEAK